MTCRGPNCSGLRPGRPPTLASMLRVKSPWGTRLGSEGRKRVSRLGEFLPGTGTVVDPWIAGTPWSSFTD
jgi:hypothetical protein